MALKEWKISIFSTTNYHRILAIITMKNIKPDKQIAKSFLDRLDNEADEFAFQTYPDGSRDDEDLVSVKHGSLDDCFTELVDLNREGAGVSVSINKTDGRGRKKENISRVRALFLDLDGPSLEPVRDHRRDPHIITETSEGRYHCYWLVEDFPLKKFEVVQKRIADTFNGDDQVSTVNTVMRLPGFYNMKEDPQKVKIIEENSIEPYSSKLILETFPDRIDKNDEGQTADQNGSALPQEIEEGERNETLTSLAGSLRHKGLGQEEIRSMLATTNQNRCKPPLNSDEIDNIANSVSDYEPGDNSSDDSPEDRQTGHMKHWDNFLPTNVARQILEQEKERGNHYAYVVDQGLYYRYQEDKGVWEEYDEEYIEKQIRNFVSNCQFGGKSGDKNYYERETLGRFRQLVTDEKNDKRFESGRNPITDRINFRNGMYDLEKDELTSHRKEDYSLVQIPWKYDPNAECKMWKDALKDWLPLKNTRDFLQEFVGYCLVPDTSQHKFLYLTGSGANGKSTFLSVLEQMFGDETTSNIPLKKLIDNARFETVYLKGKLVNFCADIDSKYIDSTGLLKKLVAGDTVRAEIKHGKAFDFRPFARLIFSANELPVSKDKSKAFYRRLKIVNFPNEFEDDDPDTDPHLKQKLEDEIPGIINWAIEGLKRLRKNSGFTTSQNLEEQMKKYKRVNDSVRAFFEDRIVEEEGNKVTTEFVMRYYQEYCDEHNIQPQSINKLVPRFKDDFGVSHGLYNFPICNEHGNYMCDLKGDCRTENGNEDKRRKGFEGIKIDQVKKPSV